MPMVGTIKGIEYYYTGKETRCISCNSRVYVPEINDFNLKALYEGVCMASINLNVRTDIRENSILFDLKRNTLNEITISTIEEGRRIMTDSSTPRYFSMDELKVALEV